MKTIFAVNGPDLCPELFSYFPKSNVVHFDSVADLLLHLYTNRISGANTYERTLSLVIHQQPKRRGRSKPVGLQSSPASDAVLNKITTAELSHLIQKQFPTFSLSVTTPTDASKAVAHLLEREQLYSNRLVRVATWMYNDYVGSNEPYTGHESRPAAHSHANHDSYSPTCSANVYTMLSHLTRVRKRRKDQDSSFPSSKLISSALDLRKLINIPKDKLSSDHYWNLISTWDFCATSLSTSELIWCSFLILKKVAQDAGFEISDNNLFLFLLTVETSYHQGNKFHNFRHAVDVMQATWQLCCQLEARFKKSSSILLVCVAAIGHDVGHPGTNNALMCDPLSPVAQLYNKSSVLENFHTEIFSDLLQEHWPQILEEQSILSDTILATDMALHSQYVEQMDAGPSEQPNLLALVIKAADISNVTRPLHISTKWAVLITCEFNECAALLKRIKGNDTYESYMPECEEPMPDCVESILIKYPSIPQGQLMFINAFAECLFAGLAECFQELKFLHNNVKANKKFWEGKCK
ncbi:LAME_0B00892g1_1 [Lachancea meyersii CBS 8951]|uniref:Phosphodiesterase n=1 Tax=Lachancea meyersii CBS 8951 TaxID=1266667 RepID=A0A1G4ISL1_9SACH|nr:LAME_0B00892g1_1 [Lachancea meyersii CBS 8951]